MPIIFYSLFIILSFTACTFTPAVNTTVKINRMPFAVEISDTPEKRVRGLSERAALAENHGMVFVYPNRDYHSIWMKGMLFPIDIVWIDGDKVIDVVEYASIPSQQVPESQYSIYRPRSPATHVLEFTAGSVQRYSIKRGDEVKFQ